MRLTHLLACWCLVLLSVCVLCDATGLQPPARQRLKAIRIDQGEPTNPVQANQQQQQVQQQPIQVAATPIALPKPIVQAKAKLSVGAISPELKPIVESKAIESAHLQQPMVDVAHQKPIVPEVEHKVIVPVQEKAKEKLALGVTPEKAIVPEAEQKPLVAKPIEATALVPESKAIEATHLQQPMVDVAHQKAIVPEVEQKPIVPEVEHQTIVPVESKAIEATHQKPIMPEAEHKPILAKPIESKARKPSAELLAEPLPPSSALPSQSKSLGLSPSTAALVRRHHASSLLSHSALVTARSSPLTCATPDQCGVTSDLSMFAAIQSHTDLSIEALHLTILPFLRSFVDLMEAPPCNLTLVAPTADSILRMATKKIGRYCADESKWSRTDACKTAKAMIQLDRIVVENAKAIAEEQQELQQELQQEEQQEEEQPDQEQDQDQGDDQEDDQGGDQGGDSDVDGAGDSDSHSDESSLGGSLGSSSSSPWSSSSQLHATRLGATPLKHQKRMAHQGRATKLKWAASAAATSPLLLKKKQMKMKKLKSSPLVSSSSSSSIGGLLPASSLSPSSSIQLIQLQVVSRLLSGGIRSFLEENARRQQASAPDVCDMADSVILLPDADQLRRVLKFVREKVAEHRQQQQQEEDEQQSSSSSQSVQSPSPSVVRLGGASPAESESSPSAAASSSSSTSPFHRRDLDIQQMCDEFLQQQGGSGDQGSALGGLASSSSSPSSPLSPSSPSSLPRSLAWSHSSRSFSVVSPDESLLLRDPSTGSPLQEPILSPEQMTEEHQPPRRKSKAKSNLNPKSSAESPLSSSRGAAAAPAGVSVSPSSCDPTSLACPTPPYQPSAADQPTDFPETTEQEEQEEEEGEGEGEGYGEEDQSAIMSRRRPPTVGQESITQGEGEGEGEGGAGVSSSTSSSRVRSLLVRPFRFSPFMQRAIHAAVAYNILPFALVTTDMPVHLIAPSLMSDPLFENLGGADHQAKQPADQAQQQQSGAKVKLGLAEWESSSSSAAALPLLPSDLHLRASAAASHSKRNLFDWTMSKKSQHTKKKSKVQQMKLSTGGSSSPDAAAASDSDVDAAAGGAIDASSSRSPLRNRFDADSQLDILIARAYAVTPQEVRTPFHPSAATWFSAGESLRAQTRHIEKEETGVFFKSGSIFSSMPSKAKIISPDIRVRHGVIQVIDRPTLPPAKATLMMKYNGLNDFAALVQSQAKVRDVVDYQSAITIFAPQDSALVDFARQLPKEKLAKLAAAVAKYHQKMKKIKMETTSAQRLGKAKSMSKSKLPLRSSAGASHSPGASLQSPVGFPTGSTWQSDEPLALAETNAHRQQRLFTEETTTTNTKLRAEAEGEAEGESGQAAEGEQASSSSSSSSSSSLVSALHSLRGEPSFDLARWCRENNVDIGEQESSSSLSTRIGRRVSPAQLSALLLSHVMVGVTPSPDFTSGLVFTSVAGVQWTMACGSDSGTWTIGGANLIDTDIATKNGVVHIIDRVLGGGESGAGGGAPGGGGDEDGDDDGGDSDSDSDSDVGVGSLSGGSMSAGGGVGQSESRLKLSKLLSRKMKLRGASASAVSASSSLSLHHSQLVKRLISFEVSDKAAARVGVGAMVHTQKTKLAVFGSHQKAKAKKSLHHTRSWQTKFGVGRSSKAKLHHRGLRLKQKLQQQKSLRLGASAGDADDRSFSSCLLPSSKHCQLVDTLKLNPAWLALKHQATLASSSSFGSSSAGSAAASRPLFSASNEPTSISCTADASKSYSRDAFSMPTIAKCYSPEIFTCARGKLILKTAIENQRAQGKADAQMGDLGLKAKLGVGVGVHQPKRANLFAGAAEHQETMPAWMANQAESNRVA